MAETMIEPIGDLALELGGTLKAAELAYVTYGTLAPARDNAILLTHGYTTTHRFVERGPDASEAPWDGLVGPGRAIDTERYFVVSSNMLGSSYGSTAPRSIDPATGTPYGSRFPAITLSDIVTAQRALLGALGVEKLVAVVGASYGGLQALAWGITFPDAMAGIVPALIRVGPAPPDAVAATRAALAADPNWNGGDYYDAPGGVQATLLRMREDTLRRYGAEERLRAGFPDKAARDAEIARMARGWAEKFDANSLLALGDAMLRFDPLPGLHRIRAKVLYVLSRTDLLFPPSLAPAAMAAFAAAGVDARYCEIDSDHGHMASGSDAAKWAPELQRFLEELRG